MWGNKSALGSWSGTKWLRKQAELWFYSLMFVNNIYNQGLERRLGRTGRFRGTLTWKTDQEAEAVKTDWDSKAQLSANGRRKTEKWPEIVSRESHKPDNNNLPPFNKYPTLNAHTGVKWSVIFNRKRRMDFTHNKCADTVNLPNRFLRASSGGYSHNKSRQQKCVAWTTWSLWRWRDFT